MELNDIYNYWFLSKTCHAVTFFLPFTSDCLEILSVHLRKFGWILFVPSNSRATGNAVMGYSRLSPPRPRLAGNIQKGPLSSLWATQLNRAGRGTKGPEGRGQTESSNGLLWVGETNCRIVAGLPKMSRKRSFPPLWATVGRFPP